MYTNINLIFCCKTVKNIDSRRKALKIHVFHRDIKKVMSLSHQRICNYQFIWHGKNERRGEGKIVGVPWGIWELKLGFLIEGEEVRGEGKIVLIEEEEAMAAGRGGGKELREERGRGGWG